RKNKNLLRRILRRRSINQLWLSNFYRKKLAQATVLQVCFGKKFEVEKFVSNFEVFFQKMGKVVSEPITTKHSDTMRVIRKQELAKILGVSKQTIWRMQKRGELPSRIQISKRVVGWREKDIKKFIETRPEVVSKGQPSPTD
ncbi:transcriptional regulator, AlpA family, partial [Fodinibius roseus]